MTTRAPAVAGLFYDADPNRLQHDIDRLLSNAPDDSGLLPKVLIVPHAGLIYSGSTAAIAYKRLFVDRDQFRRVLLLGPAHRVFVSGMAIPAVDRFATPLGEIPLDRGGLDAIAALPAVELSDAAHRDEHSLEVQLPFLQTVLDRFTLVPVLVGGADADQVAAVIDAFATDPRTLIVVSTDLSHFHEYEAADRIDASTCERILERSTTLRGEQACGARVLNGLLGATHIRDMDMRLLHRCNSGDTAGSRDRVVGYAAFELH